MTVYSRSDRTSVGGVPGCDQEHDLPKDPETGHRSLTCPVHEAWIKGDRKPRILIHKIDGGRVVGQERVADMEPGWSTTPETVPLTPDEERTDTNFRQTAQLQIDAMNALGTALANKLQIPREMMHLLRKQLPAALLEQIPEEASIPGTVVCADGHDNKAGAKFCSECGVNMAAKAAIGGGADDYEAAEPAEPAPTDLSRLHPQSLKKMCRQRGLPDTGSKDELISRLAA